jgi:hypothetical protein
MGGCHIGVLPCHVIPEHLTMEHVIFENVSLFSILFFLLARSFHFHQQFAWHWEWL